MTQATHLGPMQRALNRVARVEPQETRAVLAAFLLLFCVLGGYFAIRPVRETIGTVIGRDATRDLWLWTAVFAIAIVPFYGWLVSKVRRSILLPCIYGGTAVVILGYAAVFQSEEQMKIFGSSFYVFISVLNLLLVSIFWSFLLEMFSSDQTRRLFGFVAAGGTVGAFLGPIVTRVIVQYVGTTGILVLGATGFVLAIFFQRRLMKAASSFDNGSGKVVDDRALGGNPFAGFGLVARSSYLLLIALFVVLLSAVNTFLYFEQLRQVSELYDTIEKRTEVFASFDFIVQGLTVLTQLFMTGWIARTFGVKALLTLIPGVLVIGFIALGALGSFWALAIAMVIRRWGEYAFVRPGREMLMSRVDKESKYKAKNLIDVPVYRFSDFMFAQASKALEKVGLSSAGAAFVGAGLAAAWFLTGFVLGRRFDRETKQTR
jgi:ATP:ADP antiporter, AAA family